MKNQLVLKEEQNLLKVLLNLKRKKIYYLKEEIKHLNNFQKASWKIIKLYF
jgi:hypothetical protein